MYYSQFINENWKAPVRITSGSDWFVNWADFPANAINGDLHPSIRRADEKKIPVDTGLYNFVTHKGIKHTNERAEI